MNKEKKMKLIEFRNWLHYDRVKFFKGAWILYKPTVSWELYLHVDLKAA